LLASSKFELNLQSCWAIVTLKCIRSDQEAVMNKIEAIERMHLNKS
jgi:hypothetical protein